MKIINKYVENIKTKYVDAEKEDGRLIRSRHGQLEFFTTNTYIHKYLKKGMRILELGAGTGRYSISLAKEGYDVTAVELMKSNFKLLKKNAKGIKNICTFQGDALDLSSFKDNEFDMVLVLGPMYHLFEEQDKVQVIKESIRVAKNNATIIYAFLTTASIVFGWGLCGNLKTLKSEFNDDYTLKELPKEVFTAYDVDKFEKLFLKFNVKKLHTVSADSVVDISENNEKFNVDDEDFEILKEYHLATCERKDMLGISNHILFICKKL